MSLVSKLNPRLPREQQFASLGWDVGKYYRFNKTYRAMFPGSKELHGSAWSGIVGLLLWISGMVLIVRLATPPNP